MWRNIIERKQDKERMGWCDECEKDEKTFTRKKKEERKMK